MNFWSGGNVEKQDHFYIAIGDVKWYSQIVWQFLERLNTELPYNPAAPLVGITQENWKYFSREKLVHKMIIVALFLITKK